jgi:aminomethyltransferase
MPIGTPFHERTKALCTSYRWRAWAGYHSVLSYDICHEREYHAVRQAAALFDATPLFKYDVTGPDAGRFLARIMTRNIARLPIGRVLYLSWCDDHGKILDDGTCARLGPRHYRVTSAGPTYYWFQRNAAGFRVAIEDTSGRIASLALQGPLSRDILGQITDVDLEKLRFFGVTEASFDGMSGHLTRTGYTGDLGYELWVDNADALKLWDAVMAAGKPHGIEPMGLDALDVCRIEAGFVMADVDYIPANTALIETQKSTPFELGLGWTVKLKNRVPRFIGQEALEREARAGSKWAFVGLDIEWDATERLFDSFGLPPGLPATAWRDPIPVFDGKRQVGRATSGAWSPILKKNLALATVEAAFAEPGTVLGIEMTVEWERRKVPATVTETPFYNPPRKRA